MGVGEEDFRYGESCVSVCAGCFGLGENIGCLLIYWICNKYLLSFYYVVGMVLYNGETLVYKIGDV